MKFVQFLLAALAGSAIIGVALSQTSQSTSQSRSGGGSSTASASGSASASGQQSGSTRNSGSSSGYAARIPKPTHAIFFTPTRSWSEQAYERVKPLRVSFFAKLQRAGKLIYFGPWRDVPGEMSILVGTDAEMKNIAAEDPAVSSGLLTADVRPWTVQIDPFTAVTGSAG